MKKLKKSSIAEDNELISLPNSISQEKNCSKTFNPDKSESKLDINNNKPSLKFLNDSSDIERPALVEI